MAVCFTINVEPDLGCLLIKDVYFGKNDLPGKTLKENPLQIIEAEIEHHSYSHQITHKSKVKDIEKGITYEQMVGKRPLGCCSLIKFALFAFPTFFPRNV